MRRRARRRAPQQPADQIGSVREAQPEGRRPEGTRPQADPTPPEGGAGCVGAERKDGWGRPSLDTKEAMAISGHAERQGCIGAVGEAHPAKPCLPGPERIDGVYEGHLHEGQGPSSSWNTGTSDSCDKADDDRQAVVWAHAATSECLSVKFLAESLFEQRHRACTRRERSASRLNDLERREEDDREDRSRVDSVLRKIREHVNDPQTLTSAQSIRLVAAIDTWKTVRAVAQEGTTSAIYGIVSGPAHLSRFDPTQVSRWIRWDDALRCVPSLTGTR